MTLLINASYLLSAVGFILGLKFMAKPTKAKLGNMVSAIAMGIAITATIYWHSTSGIGYTNGLLVFLLLISGSIIGKLLSGKFAITQMPELISLFNAFGGLCAMIIGVNEAFLKDANQLYIMDKSILLLGVVLGAASFTGSIIAYFKLSNKLKWQIKSRLYSILTLVLIVVMSLLHYFYPNAFSFNHLALALGASALLYGILFSVPIGGADMPVLISLLNAVTGLATALSGIVFESTIMLLGGILVGSTGVLLTIQMCKAMNRSLKTVLIGTTKSIGLDNDNSETQEVQTTSAAETATLLAFSKKVAIIPGFGMAVAQAQKECFEIHQRLESSGTDVNYIIHPVAGRMPGHMNVLLAEANIDYKYILDMDEVNHKMHDYDAVMIIGANDVVNPAAEEDEQSVIYGMPIIKAHNSKQVVVLKRSMASGYSGATNTLFDRNNCKLLFGDAKNSLLQVLDELKKI
ncbi:MAG: NAD(P) transhydrogenase subunit beta [Flavobacteriales bacterium]|nr:NAD(P) transhydrogenase subunit beta [Flavobacteriales bacterium]